MGRAVRTLFFVLPVPRVMPLNEGQAAEEQLTHCIPLLFPAGLQRSSRQQLAFDVSSELLLESVARGGLSSFAELPLRLSADRIPTCRDESTASSSAGFFEVKLRSIVTSVQPALLLSMPTWYDRGGGSRDLLGVVATLAPAFHDVSSTAEGFSLPRSLPRRRRVPSVIGITSRS